MTGERIFVAAAGGSLACFGMVILFRQKVSSNIKQSKTYDEAMAVLRRHKGALYLLGDPIQESVAKFASCGGNNSNNIKQTDVQVKVKGPKSNGILFYSALADKNDKIHLDKVQLQIGKDDSKRLVIKKSQNETSSSSEIVIDPVPKENAK